MRYYLQRIGQAIITGLAGLFITFALYRLMPGGPLQAIVAEFINRQMEREGSVNAERVAERAETLTGINPDKPIIISFYEYVRDIVLYQDFGTSIAFQDPVFEILFRAMPWSMFVSGYGVLLGFTGTVLLGALMAWFEGTKVDSAITVFTLIATSIPYYIYAVFFLVVFGFEWGLFPTGGREPTNVPQGFNPEYMIGLVRHAALPIASTLIIGFAAGSLGMRANTVRIMGSDYLRSARIRGLGTNRIVTRYLVRNAVLPIYTQLMIGLSALFGSSVILERIFQYPGIGWYMFEALILQDYPLLMGGFVFFGGITIAGILIADLTYGLIDPRAGTGQSREAF